MLEIRLFGTGQLNYLDQAMTSFPNQQPCRVLCYLLLNRWIPNSREHISGLFWGDCTSELARKNFRNSLWRLRQMFQEIGISMNDYLFVCEESILFRRDAVYKLDIEDFENAINSCKDISSQEFTPEQVSLLEPVANLYTADLLTSIYEDWCLNERERFRLLFLNLSTKLMTYHSLNGNYERGLEHGQRILMFDNTREKVHRQMMLIYWLAGDRAAAISQYKQCTQILKDELGVYPMQETRDLHKMIRESSSRSQGSVHQSINEFQSKNTHQSSHLAKDMLDKLEFLQMMIEQANVELGTLENMIHRIFIEN